MDLELSHIKTGDQAIIFFSTNQDKPRVKFFYCNLVPCSPREYKPYDMYVCKRLELNDEYYTISKSGVVHIKPIEGTMYLDIFDFLNYHCNIRFLFLFKFAIL